MYIIVFIIILAVLVFVHELGHFLAAKSAGIRVDEFGLGFPPKLVGFKKGETTYTLNAIPFGGFVKIFGENPDDESISGPDNARSFVHKPKWIQIYVLIAGIACNLIFAWFLICAGFMIGMPVPSDYPTDATIKNIKVAVTSVQPGSPAEHAGLKTGDTIAKLVSGKDVLTRFSINDVQNFTNSHKNQPVVLTVDRGQQELTATVTPQVSATVPNRATMGVTLDMLGTLRLSPIQAFIKGTELTWTVIVTTAIGLGTFFGQIFSGHAQFGDVAGPVGIAGLVGDATRLGFVYVLSFTALISVNLALINLIPFPALDGGRILFAIIEKIKGSAIKPEVANIVNAVGFFLLIGLMIIITFHDIFRLIHH